MPKPERITSNVRDATPHLVESLIRTNRSAEIYDLLTELGVVRCVAQDWEDEPSRRAGLLRRRMRRKLRKAMSKFGPKKAAYRRILCVERRADGRDWCLHATKGWRSYTGEEAAKPIEPLRATITKLPVGTIGELIKQQPTG